MNQENNTGHHVAWADRIGLNKRWEEAIKNCYYGMLYGPQDFKHAVNAFKMLMINIKGGPQLKDQVNEYINKIDKVQNIQYKKWLSADPGAITSRRKDVRNDLDNKKAEILFTFMIQLLEDNNFCFYKGEFTGDYDTID